MEPNPTSDQPPSVAMEILAGARQLTVTDLQQILLLSRNSIYRIIDGRELEVVMIAKSYRTTEAALQRFLNRASNRQPSKAVEKVTQAFPLVASRSHAEGVEPGLTGTHGLPTTRQEAKPQQSYTSQFTNLRKAK